MSLSPFVALSLLIVSLSVSASKLELVSEIYPPLNYVDSHNKPTGLSVEVLERIWKDLGIEKQTIRILPWARGYSLALHKKNVFLFTTSRIESREHLFKWVCPITYIQEVLMAPKGTKIQIKNIRNIDKYSIAILRDDAGKHLLLEKAVPLDNIYEVNSVPIAIKMVFRGRVDLVSVADITAFSELKKMGREASELEVVWTLESTPQCFSFNHETSDELVEQYQKALNKIQGDRPYIAQLEKKYGMR